jgi:hypothetical protein
MKTFRLIFFLLSNLSFAFLNLIYCQSSYFIFEERAKQKKDGEVVCDSGFHTRNLNFVTYPTITSDKDPVKLNTSTNTITLDKGKYFITASAPAWRVNNHKLLLRDNNGNVFISGPNACNNQAGPYALTHASLTGIIEVTSTTVVKLDHYIRLPVCNIQETSVLGIAIGLIKEQPEIYAQIIIQKI